MSEFKLSKLPKLFDFPSPNLKWGNPICCLTSSMALNSGIAFIDSRRPIPILLSSLLGNMGSLFTTGNAEANQSFTPLAMASHEV